MFANNAARDNGSNADLGRPSTPTQNTFVEPADTPAGSPSKRSFPPGAHELSLAHESHQKLNANVFDTPIRLGRPQSVIRPLSPGKLSNVQNVDDESTLTPQANETALQKGSPSSPLKHQGQENTPPTTQKPGAVVLASHAALSRQENYQSPRSAPPAKKFDTSRGLTDEEREILQKPNVRRMVNVTQLCKCLLATTNVNHWPLTIHIYRLPRLLLRPPHIHWQSPEPPQFIQIRVSCASRD